MKNVLIVDVHFHDRTYSSTFFKAIDDVAYFKSVNDKTRLITHLSDDRQARPFRTTLLRHNRVSNRLKNKFTRSQDLHKGVEDDVVNASRKVDELAVQWKNMLDESFSEHLVTLKSCSSEQQSAVKVCEEQLEQHYSDVRNELVLSRQLSDHSEAVNTWSGDQNKLVEQVNTRVSQFLLEDLKDDLPTGTTPQRRPFDYPTKLIRTEPHNVLRERFQASCIPPPYSPEPQQIKVE
ncbi:Kinesin- protein 11 [Desmophyllum pertusum]|uniref:Kinesin- protein 11 n=1 Tax=Desmophyllum pertusum TaxID=174260 RepID=A0A9W9Z523_9CNID|nr:Kinesin- protein 11 [Desmophyllum pertusum]